MNFYQHELTFYLLNRQTSVIEPRWMTSNLFNNHCRLGRRRCRCHLSTLPRSINTNSIIIIYRTTFKFYLSLFTQRIYKYIYNQHNNKILKQNQSTTTTIISYHTINCKHDNRLKIDKKINKLFCLTSILYLFIYSSVFF